MAALLLLGGCQTVQSKNQAEQAKENQAEDVSWAQKYDSEDTGVFIGLNEEAKTITIKKIDSGEKLEVNYTGGTDIIDKYQSEIAIKQLQVGDIINIYYNQADKTIRKIEISPDSWEYTDVTNLTFDQTEKIMYIAEVKYRYGDNFTLLSNGEEINLLDLNAMDIVTVKGFNKKIYSVIVTRGHGYISLENDETFIDGWIDIGQESAKPITKDMIVIASEGNHRVTVAKDRSGGTKNVTVKRNEKTVVDVGDLKSETPKSGSIKFTITPSGASLYIDGVKKDYSEVVVVDYGVHSIVVRAEGRSDYTQTIVVGSSYAEIELNATGTSTSNSKSTNDSNNNKNKDSNASTGSNTGTTNNTPTVDEPQVSTPTGLNQPELNKTNGLTNNSNNNSSKDTSEEKDTTDSASKAVSDAVKDVLTNVLTN